MYKLQAMWTIFDVSRIKRIGSPPIVTLFDLITCSWQLFLAKIRDLKVIVRKRVNLQLVWPILVFWSVLQRLATVWKQYFSRILVKSLIKQSDQYYTNKAVTQSSVTLVSDCFNPICAKLLRDRIAIDKRCNGWKVTRSLPGIYVWQHEKEQVHVQLIRALSTMRIQLFLFLHVVSVVSESGPESWPFSPVGLLLRFRLCDIETSSTEYEFSVSILKM